MPKFINEIESDYSLYCCNQLQKIDSSYSDLGQKAILDYQRYKFRKIQDLPRNVIQPKGFNIPARYDQAIKSICRDIEKGNSLLKYQSRLLKRTDFDDAMLMDWGVQHLHLGTDVQNDGFVKRTGELLFVRFDGNSAYILGVFEHQNWSTIDVLEVIHENWPKTIEHFAISRRFNLVNPPPDSESIKRYREANINAPVQMRDGTVYFGPGGGITTANSPMEVTHNIMHLNRIFESAFQQIVNEFSSLCKGWGISDDQEVISVGLEMGSGKFIYTLKEINHRVSLS